MTFTGRIRAYLLVVALLPPLAILLVLYFHTRQQVELADRQFAYQNLLRFDRFYSSMINEVEKNAKNIINSPVLSRAFILIRSGKPDQVKLDVKPAGLDFLELVDNDFKVLASHHRPGLLGETIVRAGTMQTGDSYHATIEYDIEGAHTAYTCLIPIDSSLFVYTGRFLDSGFIDIASQLLGAEVTVHTGDDARRLQSAMEKGQLYSREGRLESLLAGDKSSGFVILASFHSGVKQPLFQSLLLITVVVAIFAVLIALALGFYITGSAKREIDNLIKATRRIASGDLITPVMAYEEGEFSQLADSFTDMTFKLKRLQQDLSTSEKIAAWQVMGRKIAHEIKNPLTPIAISVDDLRRSHSEHASDFPDILTETTGIIKTEVNRLTKLLDQFVSFARMSPPNIVASSLKTLIDDLMVLYRKEFDNGRLIILNSTMRNTVNLDPESIKQVLINLIKNSLETDDKTVVTITFHERATSLVITVEDTGPGFPEEITGKSPEPYVSTKKGGSGLGLVICYRIIHDHGGSIDLYNREERGAGVIIIVPDCYGKDSHS